MIPFSLIVSRTSPSLPSTLSFFLGSKDIANTSASLDLSAIRFPITRQASSSVSDGNENLKSWEFVLAADITLLVPRCITLAWINRFEKKTSSTNGLRNISVRWLHDFLLGLFAASPRDLRVHAARTKETYTYSKRNLKPFSPFLRLKVNWGSIWLEKSTWFVKVGTTHDAGHNDYNSN